MNLPYSSYYHNKHYLDGECLRVRALWDGRSFFVDEPTMDDIYVVFKSLLRRLQVPLPAPDPSHQKAESSHLAAGVNECIINSFDAIAMVNTHT